MASVSVYIIQYHYRYTDTFDLTDTDIFFKNEPITTNTEVSTHCKWALFHTMHMYLIF